MKWCVAAQLASGQSVVCKRRSTSTAMPGPACSLSNLHSSVARSRECVWVFWGGGAVLGKHDMQASCNVLFVHVCVSCQVPHDRPVVSQRMIETWIESAEQGRDTFDTQAAKQQQQLQETTGQSVAHSGVQAPKAEAGQVAVA